MMVKRIEYNVFFFKNYGNHSIWISVKIFINFFEKSVWIWLFQYRIVVLKLKCYLLFYQCCFKAVAFHSAGACGGFLQTGDTPVFLYSPGWPESYSNGANCMWLIQAPDSTVELNILSLDIESHSTCSYDKLVIRDGEKHSQSKIKQKTFNPDIYLVTFSYNHTCLLPSSSLYGIMRY